MARALAAAVVCAGAACGGAAVEPLAEAAVSLTQTPAGVGCVVIEADGADRSVGTSVNLAAGASSIVAVSALPTGAVLFSAYGYGPACGAIAGAHWTWFSVPVSARLSAGAVAQVSLTMYR